MDILEVHGILAGIEPRERPELPLDCSIAGEDCWPAAATALASISGWLPDIRTKPALLVALAHGCSLVNAEIVTQAEVAREIQQVIGRVLEWGEEYERACRSGGG